MPKDDLAREIRQLRARSRAAYREKNDEALLKIVTCLCKTLETQARLAGEGGEGPVEIVFREGWDAAPGGQEDGGPCA